MKVLPLIFSILITLMISFSLMIHKATFDHSLERSYLSYSKSIHQIQEEFQKRSFRKIPKQKEKQTKKTTENKNQEKTPKKKEELPECAKLDLSNEQVQPYAKKLFCHYYQLVFKKSSISAETFFEDLILQIKKKPRASFNQFTWNSEEKKQLYYELLNGSIVFDQKKTKNLFSIEKFFKIDPSHPKICFQCLNQELLSLFFSEQVAETLLEEKEHPLERLTTTKKNLQKILKHERVFFHDWKILTFKHQQPETSYLGLDHDISLRRTYSSP